MADYALEPCYTYGSSLCCHIKFHNPSHILRTTRARRPGISLLHCFHKYFAIFPPTPEFLLGNTSTPPKGHNEPLLCIQSLIQVFAFWSHTSQHKAFLIEKFSAPGRRKGKANGKECLSASLPNHMSRLFSLLMW